VSKRLFEVVNAIADTGFLVAFANWLDRFHAWALEILKDIEGLVLTCEAVLSETASQTESSVLVLRMLRAGMLRIAFQMEGLAGRPIRKSTAGSGGSLPDPNE
jgi:hypothetical protein